MRWMIISLLAISCFSKTLDLPVKYDPFVKAQKIIKRHKAVPIRIKRARTLHLVAIFNDKAYIDGKFYHVGDKIDGYVIEKIDKRGVLLKRGKQSKLLRLVPNHILQASRK